MIENFDLIPSFPNAFLFKNVMLRNVKEVLTMIDISILSEHSYIQITDKLTTISLVHKDDMDSNITLNVLEEYATLWYSSHSIYFDDYSGDFDIEKFMETYLNCLLGEYENDGSFAGRRNFKSFFKNAIS